MKKLIFILFYFPLISFGQKLDYGNPIDAAKLCILIQNNSFTSDKDAEIALNKILNVIGASKRFVVLPCSNIENAVAVTYKGIRYILYDNEFMSSIAEKTSIWSNTFILAHEVGHHINGHSVDVLLIASDVIKPYSIKDKQQQELEADEFAGFILAKLGATLAQASESINLLANNEDDTFSTHPSKNKRLTAIKIGFNNASLGIKATYKSQSTAITTEEYFNRGLSKYYLKDYYGAILEYSRAIDLNANFAEVFLNRGVAKYELKDNYGAIEDYTKAIELNSIFAEAFNNRGAAKGELKDNYGAISDYTKAIELNPKDASAFNNRGLARLQLKDIYGAISDYTKAIELNPKDASAYFARGLAKAMLNDLYGAISDYSNVIELTPNNAVAYSMRGGAKGVLKDQYGAIADYSKAIELNPSDTEAYSNRGLAKQMIGDLTGGCKDWKIAIKLGDTKISELVSKYCK